MKWIEPVEKTKRDHENRSDFPSSMRFSARPDGQGEAYLPLEAQGFHTAVTVESGTGHPDDPWLCRVVLRNDTGQAWRGVIRLDVPFEAAAPQFFLPGFMYGTNRGDAPLVTDSKTPRLRPEPTDFPASPWWLTRSDRLSHPVALAFTGSRVVGLSAAPYYLRSQSGQIPWKPGEKGAFSQYAGFGCDLDRRTISYTLGYENAPWFFLDSRHYRPRAELDKQCFVFESGEEVSFRAALFDYEASDARGINGALEWVYNTWHESPRQGLAPRTAVKDIAGAVSRYAWVPENSAYSGFVFDRPAGYELRLIPSISWTNGMAVAMPMLQAAIRLKDDAMRAQALACVDHIVQTSINPRNGLPYTAEADGAWGNRGWWYENQPVPGHAAYLIGQALYLVLKAWECEKRLNGREHPEWLEYVASALAVTEASRNGDGEYPYIFSDKTGAGLCYDSMSSAWCLAAAAYWTALTGDERYLPGLLASEAHYHAAFVVPMVCYGGPLDIDKQADSEGVLAYLRAVRWLHAVTGDEALLAHMRDALCYEFTFKFCYNSPIKVPPLSRIGWSSCGGSITSVTNPHIHPMSSSVVDEMLYYVRQTGDAYVRSRLEDTVRWSCQVSSTYDGEYDYGRKGWMSERFCHSQGLLTEKYPDGSPASTWFALMPWACGCILEALTGDAWD